MSGVLHAERLGRRVLQEVRVETSVQRHGECDVMIRHSIHVGAFALAGLLCAPRSSRAQTSEPSAPAMDAPAAVAPEHAGRHLPPGHPPIAPGDTSPGPVTQPIDEEDAHGSSGEAPGGASDSGALPPGHPPIGGGGATTGGSARNVRQMRLPESGSIEALDLPPGTIDVRVVDPAGALMPGVPVRLGMTRDSEHQHARTGITGSNGVITFDRLESGTHVAYRASTELDGASFSAEPFNLPANMGYHVQLVRYPVTRDPRAVAVGEARLEITFTDDRLLVNEHLSIVNFSNMSMGGEPPNPTAFVPSGGLRFGLPQGSTAFREEQAMGDQHVVEDGGSAVMRGSIPPTGTNESVDLSFQYRVRYDGTSAVLDVTLPIPVLRAVVAAQAAQGMRLVLEGADPAEERPFNGQRWLVAGRERSERDDSSLDHLHIRLENIPAAAGVERTIATVTALMLALGSIAFGLASTRGRRRTPPARPMEVLERDRARLLDAAAALARGHAAGEIGPETFNRRQRELSIALASVLKEFADAKARHRATKSARSNRPSATKRTHAKGVNAS